MDAITKSVMKALQQVGVQYTVDGYSYEGEPCTPAVVVRLISNNTKTIDSKVVLSKLASIVEDLKNKKDMSQSDDLRTGLNKAPDSIPLNIVGAVQLPNDMERKILKCFCVAYDSNNDPIYFVRKKNESGHFNYSRISVSVSGKMDITSSLISSGLFEDLYTKFTGLLHGLEKEIVNRWNNNYAELLPYALANVPTTLWMLSQVTLRGHKPADDSDPFLASSVEWAPLADPTFPDFAEASIKRFGTLVLDKLPKLPTNYGNGTVDSLNTFIIDQYKVDTKVEMSEDWKMYFARFSKDEARVYRAWIWSVIDASNHGRQCLIIQDTAGYSAKSVFAHVMVQFLGENLIAAISKDTLSNQFWGAKIWDKRLIIAGDTKNDSIMRSEKMHLITGGDYTDIEFKGQKSFAVKLNSKVLINTNNVIEIDPSLKHELTRTIIIKTKITKEIEYAIAAKDADGKIIRDSRGNAQMAGDHKFGDRLLASIDTMLINAWQDYQELCPTDTEIVLPESVLENLYNIEPVDTTAFDSILNIGMQITGSTSDIVTLDNMYNYYFDIVKDKERNYLQYNSNQAYKNFKNFLLKNHGVDSRKVGVDGKRVMAFVGIKMTAGQALATLSARSFSYNKPSQDGEVK